MNVVSLGCKLMEFHKNLPFLFIILLFIDHCPVTSQWIGLEFDDWLKWFRWMSNAISLVIFEVTLILDLVLVIILTGWYSVNISEIIVGFFHEYRSKFVKLDKIINYRLVFIKFIILPMSNINCFQFIKKNYYFLNCFNIRY